SPAGTPTTTMTAMAGRRLQINNSQIGSLGVSLPSSARPGANNACGFAPPLFGEPYPSRLGGVPSSSMPLNKKAEPTACNPLNIWT
ncbi:hypothetical protein, partial [Methylomagnum sp.]